MSTALTSHRRPVDLTRRIPVAAAFAVAILEAAPTRVIGARLGAAWAGPAPDGGLGQKLLGGARVTREVRIGVGPLLDDEGVLVLPVWWEDAEHPRLFPTFDGGIELHPDGEATEVRLVGSYEPPLGTFGRFADGLAGHRVVVASLEALLDGIAARLVEGATEGWLEARSAGR